MLALWGGFALLLVGCLPWAGAGLPSSNLAPEALGITVEGEGRAQVKPDRVEVRFALMGQALTAEEAAQRASDARETLLKKLSDLGISPQDVASLQVSVHEGGNVPTTPVPTPTPSQWRAFQTAGISVALAPKGQELASELVAAGVTSVRDLAYGEDRVTASFVLDAQGESTAKAQEEVSRKFDSIKKALAAKGLKVIEMRATQAGASPIPAPQDFSQPRAPTYVAWHTMRLSTGRLEALPQIASAVASLGRVETLTYGLSDPDALQARAREAALADAKRKAEDIASRTGNKIGRVITVAEVSSRPPTTLATPVAPGLLISVPPLRGLLEPPEDVMVVRLRVTYSFR